MNIGDGSDYVGAWTFLLPKVAPSQPSTEWRRIADMTRAALSHLLDQALLQFPLAVTSETRAERELQITTECIAVPEQLAPWVEVLRGRQQWGALEIRQVDCRSTPVGRPGARRGSRGLCRRDAVWELDWRVDAIRRVASL